LSVLLLALFGFCLADQFYYTKSGQQSMVKRDTIADEVCLYESFDEFPCGDMNVTPDKRLSIFNGAGDLWIPLAGKLVAYQHLACDHIFGGCNSDDGIPFTGIRVGCEVVTGPCNIIIDFASPQIGTVTIGRIEAQINHTVNIYGTLNGTRVGGNVSFVNSTNSCAGSATFNTSITPTSAFDRIVIVATALLIDDITFCSSACVNKFTGGNNSQSCLPVAQDVCTGCKDAFGFNHYSKVTCDALCNTCTQKTYLDPQCSFQLLQNTIPSTLQCPQLASIFPTANSTCVYSKITQ